MVALAPVELETCACPLGCPPGDRLVLIGRDRLHNLPGEFQVVQCETCHLMRTNPRPTPEAMPFYYPDSYGPHRPNLLKRGIHVPRWKRLVAALLPLKLECLPSLRPGRLLEIGCGTGAFMKHMAERGWQVEGLEASPKAAELARGLGFPVTTSSVEKASDPSVAFAQPDGKLLFHL